MPADAHSTTMALALRYRGASFTQIAARLNTLRLPQADGHLWSGAAVEALLYNPDLAEVPRFPLGPDLEQATHSGALVVEGAAAAFVVERRACGDTPEQIATALEAQGVQRTPEQPWTPDAVEHLLAHLSTLARAEARVEAVSPSYALVKSNAGTPRLAVVIREENRTMPLHPRTLPLATTLQAEGKPVEYIAAQLNTKGLTAEGGQLWTAKAVAELLARRGVATGQLEGGDTARGSGPKLGLFLGHLARD